MGEPATSPDGFSSDKGRFIAAWEQTGGDVAALRSRYNPLPHWPGNSRSGLTLGMGYDLRYQTQEGFRRDWGSRLSPEQLDRLDNYVPTIGTRGRQVPPRQRASRAAVVATRDIQVRYQDAVQVFEQTSIPTFEAHAERMFPGYSQLDPHSQTAILSVVYNRGQSMGRPRSLRRRHFMEVREAVARRDTRAIAAAIRRMKVEHTDPKVRDGLRRRREAEAQLIEQNQDSIRVFYGEQIQRQTPDLGPGMRGPR
jgi:GH24 family phage-related lysozyme (muramidase)